MTKILFVCLGNICRSPMAEFLFNDMVKKRGLSDHFSAASAATSYVEVGNPVHHGTRQKLAAHGISVAGKHAVRMSAGDYDKYDWIIGMERSNIAGIMRIIGSDPQGKVSLLLSFAGRSDDIADPYYTGDFDATYADVYEGCSALLDYLTARENLK